MAHSTLGSPFGGAGTALAVTERALSAPFGGTSPKGRAKGAAWYRPTSAPFGGTFSQEKAPLQLPLCRTGSRPSCLPSVHNFVLK